VKQSHINQAIGLIDDVIQHLDGLFDPNDRDEHIRIAQERARAALTLLQGATDSDATSAAQGLLAIIKGSCLLCQSNDTEDRFLENTGRTISESELIRVTLESGREYLLEGPFEEVSGFLVAETPLEPQQKVAFALNRIVLIQFSH